MGIKLKFSDSRDVNSSIKAPDPNPRLFSIKKIEHGLKHSILLVRYSGCTTFFGYKLMVVEGLVQKNNTLYLDPHLLGDKSKNNKVIARFEPNQQGWLLARKCMEILD